MAETITPNLKLVKPDYSESADIARLNLNTDKIDTSCGQTQTAIAIIAEGNTHPTITYGRYVYVRRHSMLPEGLYRATSSIGTNSDLSTNNLTAVSGGALNELKGNLETFSSNALPKTWSTFTYPYTAYTSVPPGGYMLTAAQASAMTDSPVTVDSRAYFFMPGTVDESFMLLIIPRLSSVYIRFKYIVWQNSWYKLTLT